MKVNSAKAQTVSALEEDLITLLMRHDRLYGAEFVIAIEESSLGHRKLGLGSLYPTLHRLESKKLVLTKWGDETSGARRKYYSITELGSNTLKSTQAFRQNLWSWSPSTEKIVFPTETLKFVDVASSLTIELSALEEDLLTLLLSHKQLYGLEFINAVKDASSNGRVLGFGSLYPALQKLESKNLVISGWGDESNGPRRKYYNIADLGRLALLATQGFRQELADWRILTEKTSSPKEAKVSNTIDVVVNSTME